MLLGCACWLLAGESLVAMWGCWGAIVLVAWCCARRCGDVRCGCGWGWLWVLWVVRLLLCLGKGTEKKKVLRHRGNTGRVNVLTFVGPAYDGVDRQLRDVHDVQHDSCPPVVVSSTSSSRCSVMMPLGHNAWCCWATTLDAAGPQCLVLLGHGARCC